MPQSPSLHLSDDLTFGEAIVKVMVKVMLSPQGTSGKARARSSAAGGPACGQARTKDAPLVGYNDDGAAKWPFSGHPGVVAWSARVFRALSGRPVMGSYQPFRPSRPVRRPISRAGDRFFPLKRSRSGPAV